MHVPRVAHHLCLLGASKIRKRGTLKTRFFFATLNSLIFKCTVNIRRIDGGQGPGISTVALSFPTVFWDKRIYRFLKLLPHWIWLLEKSYTWPEPLHKELFVSLWIYHKTSFCSFLFGCWRFVVVVWFVFVLFHWGFWCGLLFFFSTGEGRTMITINLIR